MPEAAGGWVRRRAPEVGLALLAAAVFLGFLGTVELWGKREQRAVAEAIDTVDQGHWLVARIQGRPRLEKPPLPRWTIAALVRLTGRRDEALVRLPGSLAALAMVALVYGLGRRWGGRAAGLAAGLILTSLAFFVLELRQAGNDGPLALFTTLALYAAWRRLHAEPPGEPPRLGSRAWSVLMYAALGLGFLTKGPIVVLMVALTVVPYLATVGRLRSGLRALCDAWGLALFAALALAWPVPVLLRDPNAAWVWYLEMAQKAGAAGWDHHRPRQFLAIQWPGMTAPWTLPAATALALPWARRGRGLGPAVWFAWWWVVGNLAMFCTWRIAKPNYFVPCLPGVAMLTGLEWVALTRAAHAGRNGARLVLAVQWVGLLVAAVGLPMAIGGWIPGRLAARAALGLALGAGVVASVGAWRRGRDLGALAPLAAALAVVVLIVFGAIAPAANPARGHRALAAALDRRLPRDAATVLFFQELDEALWVYLPGRTFRPVPGSQPRYNGSFELLDEKRQNRVIRDLALRVKREQDLLVNWLRRSDHPSSYLLIRSKLYRRFAPALAGLVVPILQEEGLDRNEMTLLRILPARPQMAGLANAPRR